MKKFLLCGLVFINFTESGVHAAAAIVPAGDAVPAVPYTGTYQNGILNTSPKYYDLLVTGNCDTSASEPAKLKVEGFDTAPNFFRKNMDKNDVVFAKPAPMATVQLPDGYTAYVTITLAELTAHDAELKNAVEQYVGLGIHLKGTEEGTYEEILHLSNKTKTFRMNDKNILELVPLASGTAVPDFTPVKDGDSLDKCTALEPYAETGFDFGSIFKVNVECKEDNTPTIDFDKKELTWVRYTINSTNMQFSTLSCANGIFILGGGTGGDWGYVAKDIQGDWRDLNICDRVPIFYFNGKYIIPDINYGPYISSDEGNKWSGTISVPGVLCVSLKDEVLSVPVWSDDSYNLGEVYSSSTGIDSWTIRGSLKKLTDLDSDLNSLCFGNEIVVAVTYGGYVSTSTNKGANWSEPVKQFDNFGSNKYSVGFRMAFGYNMFFCFNDTSGNLSASSDGVNWDSVGKLELGVSSITFGDDAFYILNGTSIHSLTFQ